jgi:hypothetical protein
MTYNLFPLYASDADRITQTINVIQNITAMILFNTNEVVSMNGIKSSISVI